LPHSNLTSYGTHATLPPLLAPLPYDEYSAEAYLAYVRSLYVAPPARKVPAVRIPKLVFARTKTGKLSVRTGRKPVRWITDAEMRAACSEQQVAASELFILLKARSFVCVATQEEGLALCGTVREIPW
jgi:hypothetical protein